MIPHVTTSHVEALGSVGVALAAGFASWQGIKSLNAWRRERIGMRKIELAEEALFHLYQAEHAFQSIRSPLGYSHESEDRDRSGHESPAERHGRDTAHATWSRLRANQETFDRLYTTSVKVKAVFGLEAFEPFMIFRKCFGKIRVAAQMLYRTPHDGYADASFVRRLEADIWDMDGGPETIEGQIKLAMASAEKILGPHLRDH